MTVRRTVWGGRKPKLTPEQQAELRAWAAIGRTRAQVARRYGVSVTTIDNYLRGAHKRTQHNNDHRSIA